MKRSIAVFLLVSMGMWLGCGGVASPGSGSRTPEASDLPKLGDEMPPLDDGRLLIAPPAKWRILPNSSKHLVRFSESKDVPYPTIIVTVEDFESIHNVSSDNLEQYGMQVARAMKEEALRRQEAGKGDGKVKLSDPIVPLTLGKFRGLTYGRRVRTPEGTIDQYFVETTKGGRRYVIELRDDEGAAARWRPHLLAVAAGMQFPQEVADEPAAAADAPKPEETPKPDDAPKPDVAPKPDDTPSKPVDTPAATPEPKPEPTPEPKPAPKPDPKTPTIDADDF